MPATREERLSRQEDDDGDLGDAVYVVRRDNSLRKHSNTAGRRIGKTYHATPECFHINTHPADAVNEWTREEAQLRWFAPCKSCVLGTDHWSGSEHDPVEQAVGDE